MTPLTDSPDGAARKLSALATLAAWYPDRVRAAQRVLLGLLLDRGQATVDDLRSGLGLRDGEPSRWLGAVPGELRRAGIIARAGYAETARAVAHARPVSVWELRDRAAALAWLGEHPPPGRHDAGSAGATAGPAEFEPRPLQPTLF
jgi:hypothetical protein